MHVAAKAVLQAMSKPLQRLEIMCVSEAGVLGMYELVMHFVRKAEAAGPLIYEEWPSHRGIVLRNGSILQVMSDKRLHLRSTIIDSRWFQLPLKGVPETAMPQADGDSDTA